MKTDLLQSYGHCWVFQICWHIEHSTFTAPSFRIWNSSTGIPSPPLALFKVMLPKAYLTSLSRMPGLENFETYLTSMWDECSCAVVWAFFGITFLWDWNENRPFPVLWSLLNFPNLPAYYVQHFNSIIFQDFPQFLVIHTVKGLGIVNKAEVDGFLGLSCFYDDPAALAIWSLVLLPFLNPAWRCGSSWFMYC